MYPKKTLSAASLLSECERKRCRSLEARGCAKSESEFSMGTAATCPFPMSEQSPRSIKLHQSVYARSNDPPLRQTEIYRNMKKMNSTAVTIYLKKDNRFLLLYNIRETKMLLSVTR